MVTASAGNHAQGVALAARTLGISARIYMPRSTPRVKQAGGTAMAVEVLPRSSSQGTDTMRR